MALFSRLPYHFPHFHKLGEWEWDEERGRWHLELHPNAHRFLGLRTQSHLMTFNDDRIEYAHFLHPFSMDLEIAESWINVKGQDGRDYLWNKMSAFWRNEMNAGKRIADPCDFPIPVSQLPLRKS